MEAIQKMTRLSKLFALIFSVLISVLPPAGYFFLSYEHQKAVLETEAHMNSILISQIISTAPEYWRYEQLRIGEVLAAHASGKYDEIRSVIDNNNVVIAKSGGKLYSPIITISHDLFDAGFPVARIEIQGSLLPLLKNAVSVGIFSILFGVMIFITLRVFPLRALSITLRSLYEEKKIAIESEKKFRNMAEGSLVGVYLIQDGIFRYCNNRLAEIFGYTAEELIDKRGPEYLVYPEDWHIVKENLRKRVQGEIDSIHYSFRGITKDRKTIYVDVYGAKTDYQGRSAVLGTLLDITERKKTEQERETMLLRREGINMLQRALLAPAAIEQKLRSITDSIVRIFDADFCRIWLIRSGDLCGQGCIHAEVKEGPHICRFRDRCLHLMASSGRYTHTNGKVHCRVPFGCYKIGRLASEEEHKFITNDVQNDSRVHNREWARDLGLVSFAGYQLRVPDGQTIGILALFAKHPILADEDAMLDGLSSTTAILIQQAAAEEALKKSEERFSQIAESTEEWIWEVNADGLYTYASPVVEKTLGYAPEEVVGKKYFYDFFVPNMREQMKKEAFEAFAAKSAFKKYVNPNVHKNGSIIILETSGVPILDSSGGLLGYRGVDIDITEQRKLEEQLRHSQKMEAVGTLAGGIAHDFNNILNVIIGYGTMALSRLGGDPLSREQINEVLAAADRAAALTKRLLAFSRRQAVDMKPVNVNETIIGMEKMLSRIIGEDIAITIELAERKMIVMADSGHMEQVLMNLISNARDAMPKGGRLTISTGIKEVDDDFVAAYGYGKTGTYALISVTDTGCGIDAETEKKIFEPFFTTKEIGKGTGLGLAIAYGIIKQHDGYIQVYSEVGKGATFKILLPVVEEETATVQEAEKTVTIKGGTETILVAEDDASLRNLSRIVLEAFGYTVITAEDGEDAITKYRENMANIRLLVFDMIMPNKNGKEAYTEIKNITPDIKAIFVSGYTIDIIHQKELLDEGMDYILKPFSPKDLLKKIRDALDR